MFLHLSVILFTEGGGLCPAEASVQGIYLSRLGGGSLSRRLPGTVEDRAVRILPEYILFYLILVIVQLVYFNV